MLEHTHTPLTLIRKHLFPITYLPFSPFDVSISKYHFFGGLINEDSSIPDGK